ncbi:MAG: hypothetical protein FWD48_05725 [Oscillospiraceae bacterium]|nr:hypothetical protein [Oscillospiraceae bacterium]
MKRILLLLIAVFVLLTGCNGQSGQSATEIEFDLPYNEPYVPGEDDWSLAYYGAFRNQPPFFSGAPLQNDSIKIDPSKPFVYEAEFSPFINTEIGDIYAVFPFINIDSPDVERINESIKEAFEDVQDMLTDDLLTQIKFEVFRGYDVYFNENIMSVICFNVGAFTDVPRWRYTCYNFDLITGELLTFEQLCEAAGFSREEANELTEAKIEAIVRNNSELYNFYDNSEEMIENEIKITIERFYGEAEIYWSHSTGVAEERSYHLPSGFFMADGVIYYFMYIEVSPVHWGYYPKIFSINNDELFAPETIEKYSYIN